MSKTTANYDESWKAAIGEYFEDFLRFFYPNFHRHINWSKKPVSLDKELEQITASAKTPKRYADKLFKVWLLEGDREVWILIHIEVQSQKDPDFPQRMLIYNYRAYDLYRQPVIGLAILGDEDGSWRPNYYEYGLETSKLRLDFTIVKLLDYRWEELEPNNNPFAIMVMAHLRTKSTTSNLTEREQWKWLLVRSLYERGLTKLEIVNLFKFIDKMMTLPPELQRSFKGKINRYEEEQQMPFLSTLEEMAIETTAKSTTRKNLINLLQKRFGELPESLIESLNKIEDLSVLDRLHLETISVESVEEFEGLVGENYSPEN